MVIGRVHTKQGHKKMNNRIKVQHESAREFLRRSFPEMPIRTLWGTTVSRVGELSALSLEGGTIVLVMEYDGDRGFEIYLPTPNSKAETRAAIAHACDPASAKRRYTIDVTALGFGPARIIDNDAPGGRREIAACYSLEAAESIVRALEAELERRGQ